MIYPRLYLTAAISAAVACGVWYGLNQADSGQAEPVAGDVTVEDLIDFYQAMDHDEKMKAVKAAAAATDDQHIKEILSAEWRELFHNADEVDYSGAGYVPKGWQQ